MSNEGTLAEVSEKLAIRETLAHYARGIDRYDIELAKSAYHPDATDEHGPSRGNASEVMDEVEEGMAGIEACQHPILNTLIEIKTANSGAVTVGAGTAVLVTHHAPNYDFLERAEERGFECQIVGDARSPRFLESAMREGRFAGMRV